MQSEDYLTEEIAFANFVWSNNLFIELAPIKALNSPIAIFTYSNHKIWHKQTWVVLRFYNLKK